MWATVKEDMYEAIF